MFKLLDNPEGIKRLLKLYYNIDISAEFVACADTHLTADFLKIMELDKLPYIMLIWEQENPFVYLKHTISKIETKLSLRYGSIKVNICWQSRSGRQYDISDTDINCKDLRFWFEGIDVDLCRHFISPKWSLITFPETFREMALSQGKTSISASFTDCMNRQLCVLFQNKTGIPNHKQVSLMIRSMTFDRTAVYERGTTSRLSACLCVNENWNSLTIAWDSPSGKIYAPNDELPDCSDIRFWFEGFDAVLYQKQMYPKMELPFKLRDLSFELQVDNLGVNATIELFAKPGHEQDLPRFMGKTDNHINDFNTQSEAKDRKYGLVHNWFITQKNNVVTIELDSGSAGAKFYKSLLQMFSDTGFFSKVVMA